MKINKTKPEKVNVYETIDEILNLFNHSLEQKQLTVKNYIDRSHSCIVDKFMFTTVFRNLIANSIKFSFPNGCISISSSIEDSFLNISIKDGGIGISKENMDKLFISDINFSTKGTFEEKGSGLGLIICKEFIEKNNGKIFVESEIKKGTTFTVSLPLQNNPTNFKN